MWKIIFTKNSEKQLNNIDINIKRKIILDIKNKLINHPEVYLKPLMWDFKWKFKFRSWNYRIICVKENDILLITIVKIKHRRDVYKIGF